MQLATAEAEHTIRTNIVRLDMNRLNLPTLDDNRISLASVRAEEGGRGELEVPGTGEVAAGVAEEADATALVGVEGFTPGVHAWGC